MQWLDYLNLFFWSVTYVLFIINSRGGRNFPGMPCMALALTYAWESVAFWNDIHLEWDSIIYYGRAAWFFLDTVIFMLTIKFLLKSEKKRVLFFLAEYVLGVCGLFLIFDIGDGMLCSSFLIALLISLEFLVYLKKGVYSFSTINCAVGATKLIGTMCAWLYYRQNNMIIDILGVVVLWLDSMYLYEMVIFFRKGAIG